MVEARKAMAEPGHKQISLSRQAKLLSINRTSFYRGPAASIWAEIDLSDMRIIDEIYTAKPFYGYRRITEEMQRGGRSISKSVEERPEPIHLVLQSGAVAFVPRL